jgi:hypothetical protein
MGQAENTLGDSTNLEIILSKIFRNYDMRLWTGSL